MSINQISVFVENNTGALYEMTNVLAKNGINMRAMSLAETKDFGVARIIVDDVYTASTVLKDAGYINSVTPVLGVAVSDAPGGLNSILGILAEAKIDVEYMYALLGARDADHAYMIFRVENVALAAAAMSANGVRVLDQEDMEKI